VTTIYFHISAAGEVMLLPEDLPDTVKNDFTIALKDARPITTSLGLKMREEHSGVIGMRNQEVVDYQESTGFMEGFGN